MAKIEERHRKAAEAWWDGLSNREAWDLDGPEHGYAQALADAEARIAAWLRMKHETMLEWAADEIEQGEHYDSG